MEVNAARLANIPVLPFLKRLDYEADRDSGDAKKRDAFRKEIGSWASGYFVSEFFLASDLSDKVGVTLVSVLTESYLNIEVQRRSMLTVPVSGEAHEQERPSLSLDPLLVDLVRKREVLLFAGAGMSLGAGFPSAQALVELIVSQVRERSDDLSGTALSGSFQEVAEGFELVYGRKALLEVIQKALSAPQGIGPTRAHHLSVRLFNCVLTTNFDRLFELACEQAGIEYQAIFGDIGINPETGRTLIVKIDGSISSTSSLVLTTRDALGVRQHKPHLWKSLMSLLNRSPVVIVGHSLRDMNTKGLLEYRDPDLPGYIVAPDISSFDDRRFTSRGLRVVRSDADTFFSSVASAMGLDL